MIIAHQTAPQSHATASRAAAPHDRLAAPDDSGFAALLASPQQADAPDTPPAPFGQMGPAPSAVPVATNEAGRDLTGAKAADHPQTAHLGPLKPHHGALMAPPQANEAFSQGAADAERTNKAKDAVSEPPIDQTATEAKTAAAVPLQAPETDGFFVPTAAQVTPAAAIIAPRPEPVTLQTPPPRGVESAGQPIVPAATPMRETTKLLGLPPSHTAPPRAISASSPPPERIIPETSVGFRQPTGRAQVSILALPDTPNLQAGPIPPAAPTPDGSIQPNASGPDRAVPNAASNGPEPQSEVSVTSGQTQTRLPAPQASAAPEPNAEQPINQKGAGLPAPVVGQPKSPTDFSKNGGNPHVVLVKPPIEGAARVPVQQVNLTPSKEPQRQRPENETKTSQKAATPPAQTGSAQPDLRIDAVEKGHTLTENLRQPVQAAAVDWPQPRYQADTTVAHDAPHAPVLSAVQVRRAATSDPVEERMVHPPERPLLAYRDSESPDGLVPPQDRATVTLASDPADDLAIIRLNVSTDDAPRSMPRLTPARMGADPGLQPRPVPPPDQALARFQHMLDQVGPGGTTLETPASDAPTISMNATPAHEVPTPLRSPQPSKTVEKALPATPKSGTLMPNPTTVASHLNASAETRYADAKPIPYTAAGRISVAEGRERPSVAPAKGSPAIVPMSVNAGQKPDSTDEAAPVLPKSAWQSPEHPAPKTREVTQSPTPVLLRDPGQADSSRQVRQNEPKPSSRQSAGPVVPLTQPDHKATVSDHNFRAAPRQPGGQEPSSGSVSATSAMTPVGHGLSANARWPKMAPSKPVTETEAIQNRKPVQLASPASKPAKNSLAAPETHVQYAPDSSAPQLSQAHPPLETAPPRPASQPEFPTAPMPGIGVAPKHAPDQRTDAIPLRPVTRNAGAEPIVAASPILAERHTLLEAATPLVAAPVPQVPTDIAQFSVVAERPRLRAEGADRPKTAAPSPRDPSHADQHAAPPGLTLPNVAHPVAKADPVLVEPQPEPEKQLAAPLATESLPERIPVTAAPTAPLPHQDPAPASSVQPFTIHAAGADTAQRPQRALPKGTATALVHSVTQSGHSRAELVLEPSELGRIRFDLVTQGDRVQVNLSVERPETLDLLRANAEALRQEFRASGLDASSLNFSQWSQRGQERAQPDWGLQDVALVSAPVSPAALPVSAARNLSTSGLDLRL